jgi:threonine/homoserine/homoserine lactone efflux protein
LKTGKVFCKSIVMEIIFNGIIYGITLAFLIGPVFFTIIQTSIERGFTSGIFVAIGVSLSDIFYICISYLGLLQFLDNGNSKIFLAYVGGAVLLLFGFYYIFIKSKRLINFDLKTISYSSPGKLILKGFVINGLSPMVLFFWIAMVSVATTQYGYNTLNEIGIYFTSIVVTVFTTDLIKARLADKLRALITQRFVRILNIVLGLALVGFGFRLILFPQHLPY